MVQNVPMQEMPDGRRRSHYIITILHQKLSGLVQDVELYYNLITKASYLLWLALVCI